MIDRTGIGEDPVFGKICDLGADVLDTENFQMLRCFPQHGNTSRYQHVISVCWFAMKTAELFGIPVDERSLVRGALLHDYFLYDWHDPGSLRIHHAAGHAREALETAEKNWQLNRREREIILRHMFPIDPTPPRCREGWLVTLADKMSALLETFRVPMALEVARKAGEIKRIA